ncbi:MAG: hypothetical protein L0Y56_03880 [Nitrospira sp.]|nr:hypothetical protein [Nitrospira sp.]
MDLLPDVEELHHRSYVNVEGGTPFAFFTLTSSALLLVMYRLRMFLHSLSHS